MAIEINRGLHVFISGWPFSRWYLAPRREIERGPSVQLTSFSNQNGGGVGSVNGPIPLWLAEMLRVESPSSLASLFVNNTCCL